MIRRLTLVALLGACMAGPALADTTKVTHLPVPSVSEVAKKMHAKTPQVPNWSSSVDWQKLSPAQKALYVNGVFDGICAQQGFAKLADTASKDHLDLVRYRAALQAHQKEIVAQLDAAFAKFPKQNALVLTAMVARMYLPSEMTESSERVDTAPPAKR